MFTFIGLGDDDLNISGYLTTPDFTDVTDCCADPVPAALIAGHFATTAAYIAQLFSSRPSNISRHHVAPH